MKQQTCVCVYRLFCFFPGEFTIAVAFSAADPSHCVTHAVTTSKFQRNFFFFLSLGEVCLHPLTKLTKRTKKLQALFKLAPLDFGLYEPKWMRCCREWKLWAVISVWLYCRGRRHNLSLSDAELRMQWREETMDSFFGCPRLPPYLFVRALTCGFYSSAVNRPTLETRPFFFSKFYATYSDR